jgi:hypothetical protein
MPAKPCSMISRTTVKTVAAAASELLRREEMLIEQGLGSSPFISVLEMRPRARHRTAGHGLQA